MSKSTLNDAIPEKIIAPARGKAVSVLELAEIIGIDQNTIRGYIREGMPTYQQGGKGVAHILSTKDCIDWLIKIEKDKILARYREQNPASQPESLDRLKEIKVERAELELSERRGDLVHVSDWMPLIEEVCVSVRQRLLTITNDFHSHFSDVQRVGQMTRWLNGAVTAAVNSLSTALNDIPDKANDV